MIDCDFGFFFLNVPIHLKKKSYGQINRTKTIASQRFLLEPIFLFSKQAPQGGAINDNSSRGPIFSAFGCSGRPGVRFQFSKSSSEGCSGKTSEARAGHPCGKI